MNDKSAARPSQSTEAAKVRLLRLMLVPSFFMMTCSAMGWWSMMPKGFPITHPRFWMNTALPLVGIGLCLAAILATFQKKDVLINCFVIFIGSLIIVAGISSMFYFPKSISGSFFIAIATSIAITIG